MSFEDVSRIVFATAGVNAVVADFQRQENAALRMEAALRRLNAVKGTAQEPAARFSLETADRSFLQGAARQAAQAATIRAQAAVSFIRAEISAVEDAIEKYVQYGRTVQNIQSLSGAGLGASEKFANLARVAGVPDQQAVREILKLTQSMFSGKGQSALQQLGVSSAGKDSLQVFTEITGRLSQMQDGAKKTSLEMQIFGGRLTQSLQPFLHLSQDIIERTNDLNSHLNGGAIAAINHFQQSSNLLGQTILNDLVYPVTERLIPALTWLINTAQRVIHAFGRFNDMTHGLLSWIVIVGGIAAGFVAAAIAVQSFITILGVLKDVEIVQIGIQTVLDALQGPKGWIAIGAAVALGGAAYIGYQNQQAGNQGDGDDGSHSNSTERFADSVNTFSGAVNQLKTAWSTVAGGQIPSSLSEADCAVVVRQRVEGAVG